MNEEQKKIIEEGIKQLTSLNLKDDKKFPNFNYDSIILSKAFLYYYDKLISKNIFLDCFKGIKLNELRRLVEDYENSIMRKPMVRSNVTRIIEPHKDIMVSFVSVIENQEDEGTDYKKLKERYSKSKEK